MVSNQGHLFGGCTKLHLDTVSEMYAMSEITSVYDDAEQAFKVSFRVLLAKCSDSNLNFQSLMQKPIVGINRKLAKGNGGQRAKTAKF